MERKNALWWAWYAIRLPSRAIVLAVIAASFVQYAMTPEFDVDELDPFNWWLNSLAGVAILVVLLGWRWFWTGRAVVERRMADDPSFRSRTVVIEQRD